MAFANTAGGTVVIGLDDDGSVVGVADPLREEERLSSRISDGIEPQLLPEIHAVSHGEQELLVIEVAHHPAPFHLRSEGPERGVYVRLGSTSSSRTITGRTPPGAHVAAVHAESARPGGCCAG